MIFWFHKNEISRTSYDTAYNGTCVVTRTGGSGGRRAVHNRAGVENGSYLDLGGINLAIGSNTDKMDVSKRATRLDGDEIRRMIVAEPWAERMSALDGVSDFRRRRDEHL